MWVMSPATLSPLLLRSARPSRAAGTLVALASVAAATGVIYPLKQFTPVLSLGVLYVLAVVVVSAFWGLAFVVGKPKSGKSTLVRQLILAVATGIQFLGFDTIQCSVLYLAIEECDD
jgi:hypothetical protein